MTGRNLAVLALGAVALATGAWLSPAPQAPAITVYKSPACGCCAKWVDHLRAAGFKVVVHDTDDLAAVKASVGVPTGLASCHTALVGGYLVEGHVPADLIRRLLRERPAAAGLAVPGMPGASPGMDVPRAGSYDVLVFDKQGKTRVYATR